MEEFDECAGIEEKMHFLAIRALVDYIIRPAARQVFEPLTNLLKAKFFYLCSSLVDELRESRAIARLSYFDRNLLVLVQRKWFQWTQDALSVDCFKLRRHDSSIESDVESRRGAHPL